MESFSAPFPRKLQLSCRTGDILETPLPFPSSYKTTETMDLPKLELLKVWRWKRKRLGSRGQVEEEIFLPGMISHSSDNCSHYHCRRKKITAFILKELDIVCSGAILSDHGQRKEIYPKVQICSRIGVTPNSMFQHVLWGFYSCIGQRES